MPYNGSGTFQRVRNWVADAAAAIKIRADYHDTEDDGFAAGLSNAICKDGQTTVTQNIPFNAKRITNLGDPVNPQDAVTKAHIDSGVTGFVKKAGDTMTGAFNVNYANPVITLNKAVGAQASTLQGAVNNVARWIMQLGGTSAESGANAGSDFGLHRYADDGSYLGQALTINRATGAASFGGADVAANTFTAGGFIGPGPHIILTPAVGNVASIVYLRPNGLSNSSGETTVSSTGNMNVNGQINCLGIIGSANLTMAGTVQANSGVFGSASGTLYLRPHGVGNNAGQVTIDANGAIQLTNHINSSGQIGVTIFANVKSKAGLSGGYGGNSCNMYWTGSSMSLYVDDVYLGPVNTSSDYRIKKGVADLPSTWDRVKALRPIKYTQAEFTPPASDAALAAKTEPVPGPLFKADNIERWGFIAHEAQSTLLPTASSGVKDMKGGVQGLNWSPFVAAITKTLQEAQARIEALEAKVAALEAA